MIDRRSLALLPSSRTLPEWVMLNNASRSLPDPSARALAPIAVAGEWRAPLLHRYCCYNAEAYLTVTYNAKRPSLGGLMCPFCL